MYIFKFFPCLDFHIFRSVLYFFSASHVNNLLTYFNICIIIIIYLSSSFVLLTEPPLQGAEIMDAGLGLQRTTLQLDQHVQCVQKLPGQVIC